MDNDMKEQFQAFFKDFNRFRRQRMLLGGAMFVTSVYFGYQRLQPRPLLYCRGQYGIDSLKRPLRPQIEFKFGNGGFGPMIIHEMKLIKDGKELIDAANSLPTEHSYLVSSEIFTSVNKTPRVWGTGHPVAILTLYQKKERLDGKGDGIGDDEWIRNEFKSIREKNIQLYIEYSCTDSKILHRFLKVQKVEPLLR